MTRPLRMNAKLWALLKSVLLKHERNLRWVDGAPIPEASEVVAADSRFPMWHVVAEWLDRPTQVSMDARHFLEHGEDRVTSKRLAEVRRQESERRADELRRLDDERRRFAPLRAAAAAGDRRALRQVAAMAPRIEVVMKPEQNR